MPLVKIGRLLYGFPSKDRCQNHQAQTCKLQSENEVRGQGRQLLFASSRWLKTDKLPTSSGGSTAHVKHAPGKGKEISTCLRDPQNRILLMTLFELHSFLEYRRVFSPNRMLLTISWSCNINARGTPTHTLKKSWKQTRTHTYTYMCRSTLGPGILKFTLPKIEL